MVEHLVELLLGVDLVRNAGIGRMENVVRGPRIPEGDQASAGVDARLVRVEAAVLGGKAGAALVQRQGVAEELDGLDVTGVGKA